MHWSEICMGKVLSLPSTTFGVELYVVKSNRSKYYSPSVSSSVGNTRAVGSVPVTRTVTEDMSSLTGSSLTKTKNVNVLK